MKKLSLLTLIFLLSNTGYANNGMGNPSSLWNNSSDSDSDNDSNSQLNNDIKENYSNTEGEFENTNLKFYLVRNLDTLELTIWDESDLTSPPPFNNEIFESTYPTNGNVGSWKMIGSLEKISAINPQSENNYFLLSEQEEPKDN